MVYNYLQEKYFHFTKLNIDDIQSVKKKLSHQKAVQPWAWMAPYYTKVVSDWLTVLVSYCHNQKITTLHDCQKIMLLHNELEVIQHHIERICQHLPMTKTIEKNFYDCHRILKERMCDTYYDSKDLSIKKMILLMYTKMYAQLPFRDESELYQLHRDNTVTPSVAEYVDTSDMMIFSYLNNIDTVIYCALSDVLLWLRHNKEQEKYWNFWLEKLPTKTYAFDRLSVYSSRFDILSLSNLLVDIDEIRHEISLTPRADAQLQHVLNVLKNALPVKEFYNNVSSPSVYS